MDEQEAPRNEDPEVIHAVLSTFKGIIQLYGWLILVVVIAVFYLQSRLRPKLQQWSHQREEDSYKKMDAGVAQDRLEAMEKARQKMQAQLDAQAKEYAERQKQREEEKRQERIADWDRHQEGKGYRSKTRKAPEERPTAPPSSGKPKPKKNLKTDYNPLMGDTGGACYRPSRRGGAGGGG